MAKFCGQCGAQMDDEDRVCGNCGIPLGDVGGNASSWNIPGGRYVDPAQEAINKKRIKIGLGMVAVVVIAVIAVNVMPSVFRNTSSELEWTQEADKLASKELAVVDKFMKANFEADAETLITVLPDEIIEYLLEEIGGNKEQLQDVLVSQLQTFKRELDYMGEWEYSYKILEVSRYDSSELRELNEGFYEEYYSAINAKEAKEVELEININMEDVDIFEAETAYLTLAKIDGSWYVVDSDFYFYF